MALRYRLFVACLEGLEPPTCCLEGSCSIQLSYRQPWPTSLRHGTFQGRQRLSQSALRTTLTLLKAMAAPARMGLSPPRAAMGMPTTL